MVQEPFFFELTGGAHAQHGLRYMAGVIEADFLDENPESDLVATDRSSVRWDEPPAQDLLLWGQTKLREWLTVWGDFRAEKRLTRLRTERPALAEILDSLQQLPPGDRDEITTIVRRLATNVEDDENLAWAVDAIQSAYGDRRFIALAQSLATVESPEIDRVIAIFREYELLESARLAQITAARMEVLSLFERLIAEEAPEKAPDVDSMQGILMENPWLQPRHGHTSTRARHRHHH